jgi:hypothetical protein
MTREEREQALDKLLVFMNDEIENAGCIISNWNFDFETVDAELLKEFGSIERLHEAVRIAISRNFIKHFTLGYGEYNSLRLTEEGQGRAISVINEKYKNDDSHSNFSIGTVNNYGGNTQIGDNNTQNISNAVKLILDSIEKANASNEEKTEVKNLFSQFLNHPLTQTLISAGAGIGAALI